MGLFGLMHIHESGIGRRPDPPTTPNPTLTSSPCAPTTISATDTDTTDLSCPHCPRTFTSRIGLVGHLRIHRTETGEPVPVGVSGLCAVVVGTGAAAADVEVMEIAAQAQLQLSQHGVDAEDSCPFQYVRVRNAVLPPSLQYPSKTAEVEMTESLRLLLVDRPGLHSIQQRQQDDCLVHLQFGVGLVTVTSSDAVLQTAEGLDGFENPASHLIVDIGVAGEGAAQVGEIVHDLKLGAVHGDLGCDVGIVGWLLVHNHRFLCVEAPSPGRAPSDDPCVGDHRVYRSPRGSCPIRALSRLRVAARKVEVGVGIYSRQTGDGGVGDGGGAGEDDSEVFDPSLRNLCLHGE
ncbi:hypothetical protein SprV_0200858700 [Sparganum proliferum]